jgi:hypothetical protein
VIELELVLKLNAGVELEVEFEDKLRCLSVGRVIPL